MKRSQIREEIFKLLFRVEFNDTEDMKEQLLMAFDKEYPDASEFTKKEEAYVRGKFENLCDKLPEIDEIINQNAKGWSIDRIGKVELSILRLAIYEMKFDEDIPVSVAIDEAVNLAKKFGQESSGGFVNGVLAKIV